MSQDCVRILRSGSILASPEKNILAGGESACVQGLIEPVGVVIGVDTHAAEIGTHGLLHRLAHVLWQGLPAAPGLLNVRLQAGIDCGVGMGRLTRKDWASRLGGGASPYVLSHLIGLAFEWIISRAEQQLGLNDERGIAGCGGRSRLCFAACSC